MQTPNTPAGHTTEIVMMEVRKRHPKLETCDYNRMWEACHRTFSADPDPAIVGRINTDGMNDIQRMVAQVMLMLTHLNPSLSVDKLAMIGVGLTDMFSRPRVNKPELQVMVNGAGSTEQDNANLIDTLKETEIPKKIIKLIRTGRWVWIKKEGRLVGVQRKSTGERRYYF